MMMKKIWVWMLLTLLTLVGEWYGRCYGCLEEERTGLLEIKALFNPNSNIGTFADWTANKDDVANCCDWSLIECDSTTRRVIRLSLGGAREWRLGDLVLNASLFLPFKELQTLDLSYNRLVSCFENEGFEVLSSRLRKLNLLDLSANQLNNDSFFSSLTGFSSLKSLHLSYNQLIGGFYGFKVLSSRLKKLENLYLRGNQYNDSIFSSLTELSSLKTLDLSQNQLTGLDGFYGLKVLSSRLKKLENLYLYRNQYNDSIFSSLTGLSSLKSLDLSLNQLTGSDDFHGFKVLSLRSKKLENLNLRENQFNDSIFSSLSGFSSLKSLDLSWNMRKESTSKRIFFNSTTLEELRVEGTSLSINFLQNIGTLPELKILSLSLCDLNGTLTKGLCELKNLEQLDLSRNNLEGSFPNCLGNLSSLQLLDVSTNKFIGNIASGPLTNLKSLELLSLSNNNFEVPLSFKSFMNHSKLKLFICDNNTLIREEVGFHNFIPKFQLMFFSLSHSTSVPLNADIPNFLYDQYDLRVLDLSYNNFSGMFPSWLLKNNTRLEQLYLKKNSFVGPLKLQNHPNPNISVIDISSNNIHGQIPRNMCLLFPGLSNLGMAMNKLTGSLPSCFGNISSLDYIDVSDNQLSIVNLEQLRTPRFIKLSNNNLGGQISHSIFNSSTLECLCLDDNNFTRHLPDFQPTSLISLRALDISNNQISGILPAWMGNISYLQAVDLSRNHFEDSVPIDFCNLDNLEYLDMSENNFSGSIPYCLNSAMMKHVHLSKNQLSGPLTNAFYNSSFLVTLDLTYNNFLGSIPKWFGNLSELSVLLLKANHFSGEFPTQLCLLEHLSILDVSQNKLFGRLPSCLGNYSFKENLEKAVASAQVFFPSEVKRMISDYTKLPVTSSNIMESGYASINIEEAVEFTTKRMSYDYKGNILNFMSGFDLSSNRFSGEIPIELGDLSEIHALNLSHNNLSGSIPATFSNLKQIESLDLSFNNLNGTIPPQLTVLNNLAVFNVAYNNLSGKTPELKYQFGTFDFSSYEGNPFLCGPPLQKKCIEDESPLQQMPSGGQEDDGFIDMNVFFMSFGVCYTIVVLTIPIVLYINPYWRRRWFHFIEEFIDTCYFFVVINFHRLSNFKRS